MSRKTDGDEDKTHFQMDRFYQSNGEWFYTVRGSDEKGPFASKKEAEADLATYVREKLKMDQFGE